MTEEQLIHICSRGGGGAESQDPQSTSQPVDFCHSSVLYSVHMSALPVTHPINMPERHPRSRSGSPHRHESRRHRHRSRSPRRHQNSTVPRKALPLGAREISRHDLSSFRPLFALYLDIQKQIDIEELDDNEVKGRWKSFVGKW